nr:MAG TPA: PORTAL PROTEIN [Caudoviricetes sp.]
MELEAAKKLIEKYEGIDAVRLKKAEVALRYYLGDNDIMYRKPKDKCEEPLRNADNRIAFNFHSLLVDQKASYMFTAPPLFDAKDDTLNEIIAATLGDGYAKKCKDLCVDASNAGVGWLHYWIDEKKGFCYGVIPSMQVRPVYSLRLEKELEAVLRTYRMVDDNGDEWQIYEIWNDTECQAYRKRAEMFQPFDMFSYVNLDGMAEPTNTFRHDFGAVPFIAFPNNNVCSSDLDKIKHLIDSYDKTYSGFVDDLEDIQQVVFVLTNYGGADLKQFLSDLKYYKTIQVESAGSDDKSGVSTLTIDIPVEARDKLLDITRKAIFDMGQGIDPQQQGFDNTSGEAMKFLYSLLELKAGLMETEFRSGFGELVRAIGRYYGKEPEQIVQTWTRTSIRNDAELVDMCQKSVGVISTKTILKNHPFVENAEDEEKELAAEKEKAANDADIYRNAFNQQGGENIDGNQN